MPGQAKVPSPGTSGYTKSLDAHDELTVSSRPRRLPRASPVGTVVQSPGPDDHRSCCAATQSAGYAFGGGWDTCRITRRPDRTEIATLKASVGHGGRTVTEKVALNIERELAALCNEILGLGPLRLGWERKRLCYGPARREFLVELERMRSTSLAGEWLLRQLLVATTGGTCPHAE